MAWLPVLGFSYKIFSTFSLRLDLGLATTLLPLFVLSKQLTIIKTANFGVFLLWWISTPSFFRARCFSQKPHNNHGFLDSKWLVCQWQVLWWDTRSVAPKDFDLNHDHYLDHPPWCWSPHNTKNGWMMLGYFSFLMTNFGDGSWFIYIYSISHLVTIASS